MRRAIRPFIVTVLLLGSGLWGAQQNPVFNPEKFDIYLKKAVEDFEVPGMAVTIIKDGRRVFQKGYGKCDITGDEVVSSASLFNIASCTKAFTAACVGILVDDGKLSWDDKVIDYLPEFRLQDPYVTHQMTVRDLLCHRSGLGTYDGDLLWYRTQYDHWEILKRMKYLPLRKSFRSEWGYQNLMYLAAGLVVERASGLSWSDFLTQKILQPLGMAHTRSCSQQLGKENPLALPHHDMKPYPLYVQAPFPAGSMFSNVRDMEVWIKMLLKGGEFEGERVLNQKTVEELLTPQMVRKTTSFMKQNGVHFFNYGLGWNLFDYHGRKVAEHSGGMPGYEARVLLVPELNLGAVILVNQLSGITRPLVYRILDNFLIPYPKDWVKYFLTRHHLKKSTPPPDSKGKPALPLHLYSGLYRDKMYGEARVQVGDKQLILTLLPVGNMFSATLKAYRHNTFKIKFKDPFVPPGYINFHLNSEGRVIGFKLDISIADLHFNRLSFRKMKRSH